MTKKTKKKKLEYRALVTDTSGCVMFYFADRLFFELLRSLSPGGECLIELKH